MLQVKLMHDIRTQHGKRRKSVLHCVMVKLPHKDLHFLPYTDLRYTNVDRSHHLLKKEGCGWRLGLGKGQTILIIHANFSFIHGHTDTYISQLRGQPIRDAGHDPSTC